MSLLRSFRSARGSVVCSTSQVRRLSHAPVDKVFPTAHSAIDCLQDNMSFSIGGFGMSGIPENLIDAIVQRGTRNLTALTNDVGTVDFGVGKLISSGQITVAHTSYVGENKKITEYLKSGALELHLNPQGTLAEKMRAAGAGIPAFYTPAGLGTAVELGGHPIKYKGDGSGEVEKVSQPKTVREFNGRKYVIEEALHADVAIIKGFQADRLGNVRFRATARNFNVDCAKCAKTVIVEVEEIVDVGKIHPDDVHLPGIYVDRVVLGEHYSRRIEKLRHSHPNTGADVVRPPMTSRDYIARRAGQELKDGMYVNLGIGIPTVVSNYIPKDIHVTLQSENGLLGMGPYPLPGEEDSDLCNAGKETITYLPGSSTFSSSESFAMIRGGHVDITILGALQVSASGDLASWVIPGKTMKGMGGAMDLVAACKHIIVTINHTDKHGHPKIVRECSLPITGKGIIDMIITELAVFHCDRHGGGLTLLEIAEGCSLEELRTKTGADFQVSPDLKVMDR